MCVWVVFFGVFSIKALCLFETFSLFSLYTVHKWKKLDLISKLLSLNETYVFTDVFDFFFKLTIDFDCWFFCVSFRRLIKGINKVLRTMIATKQMQQLVVNRRRSSYMLQYLFVWQVMCNCDFYVRMIWKKFAPYAKIGFPSIIHSHGMKISHRARDFLHLLPSTTWPSSDSLLLKLNHMHDSTKK